MKRTIIVPGLVTAFVALSPVGVALADNPHFPANPNGPATGQPSQTANVNDPGVTSPAGFGSGGFAKAELVYANPGSQGGLSSGNTHVVSQYDVAGYQWCQHHSGACSPTP